MADEPTQAQQDTAKAASRLNTDNRAVSTNEATQRDTESAQDRTKGASGFSKLERRMSPQPNQDQQRVVYSELNTNLTTPQLASFSVIVCVDGVPWNATINGSLTGEVR